VTPVLILLLGSGAVLSVLEQEWVHKTLLLPVLLFAALSIPKQWLKTRNQTMLILASVGICAFLSAMFFHGFPEVVLTMIGSACLISAHLISLKLSKQANYQRL
jgi:predicted acyltransferase